MSSPSSSGKTPAQLLVADTEEERVAAKLPGFVTQTVFCRSSCLRIRSPRRPSSSLPVPQGYLTLSAKCQGICYNHVISCADRRGASVCRTRAVNRPPLSHAHHVEEGSVLVRWRRAGKVLPALRWYWKARRQGMAKMTQNKQTRAQEMVERCQKAAETQLCCTFGLHERASSTTLWEPPTLPHRSRFGVKSLENTVTFFCI